MIAKLSRADQVGTARHDAVIDKGSSYLVTVDLGILFWFLGRETSR
jgi:hypothetical protein